MLRYVSNTSGRLCLDVGHRDIVAKDVPFAAVVLYLGKYVLTSALVFDSHSVDAARA